MSMNWRLLSFWELMTRLVTNRQGRWLRLHSIVVIARRLWSSMRQIGRWLYSSKSWWRIRRRFCCRLVTQKCSLSGTKKSKRAKLMKKMLASIKMSIMEMNMGRSMAKRTNRSRMLMGKLLPIKSRGRLCRMNKTIKLSRHHQNKPKTKLDQKTMRNQKLPKNLQKINKLKMTKKKWTKMAKISRFLRVTKIKTTIKFHKLFKTIKITVNLSLQKKLKLKCKLLWEMIVQITKMLKNRRRRSMYIKNHATA